MRSFVRIDARTAKNTKYGGSSKNVLILRPTFHITGKDLMKKGNSFYAVLDPKTNMWSNDESTVYDIIDSALYLELKNKTGMVGEDGIPYDKYGNQIVLESIDLNTTRVLDEYTKWRNNLPNNFNYKPLDSKIIYKEQEVVPEDYCSKKLPYNLSDSDCPSYNELMNTLYDEDNRRKIEWLIGCIFAGESIKIEKMGVLYGKPGSGKSTVLDIIKDLFEGYWAVFSSEHLTNKNKDFATSYFKDNPLVAIEDDGSMSKIDNPVINEIISHKEININEKYKGHYQLKPRSILFMATNDVVDLNNEMGGMSRRLLDIYPTNKKIPVKEYRKLVKNIRYELGAIANHCLKVYESMGPEYYIAYKPQNMINKSSYLRNFVMDEYDFLLDNDPISKTDLFNRYIKYVDDSKIPYPLTRIRFSEQILSYYKSYEARYETPNKIYRNVFVGFKGLDSLAEKEEEVSEENYIWLHLDKTKSKFDRIGKNFKAQYVIFDKKLNDWRPAKKWENVKTTLSDIDTTKEHYTEVPLEHIIFDFDLKNPKTKEKDPEKNIEAASHYPATYAEFSKSGGGIHLHYIYNGDVSKLANKFTDEWGNEVEIKHGSEGKLLKIRRKLSYCNDLNIAILTGGLPEKEKKKVALDKDYVMTEKKLLSMIERCLNKEFGSTTQCINFIDQLLNEAAESGNPYFVPLDLRKRVLAFANNSTNQAEKCLKTVANMKWQSEEEKKEINIIKKDQIIFFDVEVFPNFFCLCYKLQGKENPVVKLMNPTGDDLRPLLDYKLIGFNNIRYDNHILYAKIAYNYSNVELYSLSQSLINSKKGTNPGFTTAKHLSYTDIYDFASAGNKQSLKKWEIELGINHVENSYAWDKDLPEAAWQEVADYCSNDVIATEAVFDHLKSDFVAREILADLSGLTVNDSTNQHTTRIILGENTRFAKNEFVYTDLSKDFPGYKFEAGKSYYRDEIVGEGGYVYSEPGCYTDVALLDIASMHPSSITALNLFGPYTKNFNELKEARLAIKHKDFNKAKKLLDGKLAKYLNDEENIKNLPNALKTAINSVYGMTSSKIDFALKDPRNKDNIVAKRGALFMVDLKHAVQEQGFTVAHIKTDSIKIPNATHSIIEFVMDYGEKWGYTFEHEATYKRMCLVNDAVYIALYPDNHWSATGTQFQIPYVFKTLFSKEEINFSDLCIAMSTQTSFHLDFNEDLPEGEHNYIFTGKVGNFCPVKEGCGGGQLMRIQEVNGEKKYYAATGSKGYRWKEAEVIKANGLEDEIDFSYFDKLADDAKKEIEKYVDYDWFADPNSNNELVPFK